MFDYLIFADWPKGLYLAQKLSEKNQKVAYVERLPHLKSPFGFFLKNKNQKTILENIGFLSEQKGGFCLIGPKRVWSLQDMKSMKARLPTMKNFNHLFNEKKRLKFKNNWLSYLSLNLTSKIFEFNNSVFQTKGINLLDDYFLFEPSAKKSENFKNSQTNISFFSIPYKKLSFKKEKNIISLKEKNLTTKKFICLTSTENILADFKSNPPACWEWQAFYLKADFQDYKEIIPHHFIFLKNIHLPWCYDNLLSVFYRQGVLEVWMKLKTEEDSKKFISLATNHLKSFFKGSEIKTINKPLSKGFKVFGKEKLESKFQQKNTYIESYMDFFHGDLSSEIQNEEKLFKSL